MKVKLMPLFAGVITFASIVTPLAAQACNGGDKDKGTSETNVPERTQTSSAIEEISFLS